MNEALRQELLALVKIDHELVGAPVGDRDSVEFQTWRLGSLARIRERFVGILDVNGWPGRSLVGEDGAEAAWMLAMHTMPEPDVLRRCVRMMTEAADAGEVDPSWVPTLVDRLSLVERGLQIYGTTICRQPDGTFAAPNLEDPDRVDERRRAVGLPQLADDIRKVERLSGGDRIDEPGGAS